MIAFFPTPHPDELFYSAVARYKAIMQYSSGRFLLQELFGDQNVIATIDLPSRLDYFAGVLPFSHTYSPDRIIAENTLLPFYAPFLPIERLNQVKADMREDRGGSVHMRLGIMASRVRLPDWLRFCPLCALEERQKFPDGCYWHRTHQLPGVLICPEHGIHLQDSDVVAYNRRSRYAFVTADSVIPKDLPISASIQLTTDYPVLQHLALDAAWLLEQRDIGLDSVSIHQRYLKILTERDLATYTGQVSAQALLSTFQQYYPQKLLSLLHCELEEGITDNWLFRLVRKPSNTQHPLHHLLLIHFLGHSAESFFRVELKSLYFGSKPWPCLNATCQFYRQSVISNCQITFSQDSRCPVGTFKCKCGFTYARLGPDQTERDRFRYSRVEAFGEVWEASLRRHWPDPAVCLRDLARRLGVTPKTVNWHAVRLGLIFPRPNARGGKKPNPKSLSQDSTQMEIPTEVLEKNQSRWLEILKMYPDASITELRSHCPALYTWHYRHNREWLNLTRPKPQELTHVNSVQVNWLQRDILLAVATLKAALVLLQHSGRPIHITMTAIAREAKCVGVIQKHPQKLPVTMDLLARLAESRQEFAVRRVWWTANNFLKDGIMVTRWLLIKESGTERVKDVPEVNAAIDAALDWLEISRTNIPGKSFN